MSNYHVYGIGNALLDMQCEVDYALFDDLGIKKGLMTLIDEKTHDALLFKLKDKKILKTCGGSAANTMIAISQLGGNAFYSCKIADDNEGLFYASDLLANGVKSNISDKRPKGTTGKCIVMVTPDADRTMNTFLGITNDLSETELIVDELKNSKILYIEGYLTSSKSAWSAVHKAYNIAKSCNIKTSLTLSDPSMITYFKPQFAEIMNQKVDILFCNEAEALAYTHADDINQAAKMLMSYAKTFAITQGANGALVYDGKEILNILGKKVVAIDTNGAGDIFAGTFLFSLSAGMNFLKAAENAIETSAQLVTKVGARLKKDEILSYMKYI